MLDKDAVEAVLFDLDGTLMDTDDQTVARLAGWLRRLRWPRPADAARRLVMSSETPANAFVTLLDVFGLDGPFRGLSDRLCRLRGLRTQADFLIIPGVREMLAGLDSRYRLAVVTTRNRRDAEAFLGQYGLRSVFSVITTSESTWRLKPHPAPIRHTARQLNVPVERCAMVGDTTVDVKAARRARAWAVGVLCGFGERGELERAGAHVVLGSTAELSSLL